MISVRVSILSVVVLSSRPASAAAAEPADATGEAATSAAPARAPAEPWIKRHRPTRNQLELGIYGGVLLPARDHELYDPADASVTWQPYRRVAPDVGLRVGFYPLSVLGLEIEGGVVPTRPADDGARAVLGTFRGHALAQLPYRITPFALFGLASLGTTGLGGDADPALHFGGGVKFYVTDLIALRLDIRDTVATRVGAATGRTHHPEVLLGLSLVLGRKKPADPDSDGDGFKDKQDACPQVPGVAPDGCPPPDRDGDGILDPVDRCPDDPETKNNYQDEDGCPDEVPREVKKFTGVIEGIYFDTDQDVIKPSSLPTLQNAAKVMQEFPDMKVEISGHTDADGDRGYNIDLSRRRAEAVRKFLIGAGVAEGRITTRGAGADEPIGDNGTADGKAKNRRIEFALIQ